LLLFFCRALVRLINILTNAQLHVHTIPGIQLCVKCKARNVARRMQHFGLGGEKQYNSEKGPKIIAPRTAAWKFWGKQSCRNARVVAAAFKWASSSAPDQAARVFFCNKVVKAFTLFSHLRATSSWGREKPARQQDNLRAELIIILLDL
jgi:hypothetical protein